MFEFVRKHTRILQFVLVLLIFPSFVFFGIQGYSRFTGGENEPVAKVDGNNITQAEWSAAQRDQIERVRRQMPGVDPKLFDTPEMKQQVLDGLIRERVLLTAAGKLHLVTTNERLQRELLAIPQLSTLRKPDGSIDLDAYKALLGAQGMTPEMFEARMRQDTTMRQVLQGVGGTAFGPAGSSNAAFDALLQQREIQVQRFDAKDYLAKVNPTDAELEAYYKAPENASQFEAPEQASIEYVVLDLDAIKKDITVPEDELRKYYAENEKRFAVPEERRASHILVKAEKSAPAADREKARAKAEQLLAEVKKSPGSFADIARKNSDDPGSAARGGDLDFFGRGAMVKPFEDAAFGLKQGEISGIVESDFGYHIIQVTGARGGEKKTFEQVRAEIEEEAKKQQAQTRFAAAAVDFSNMVYEQADSLKPAAEKFKLEVRTAKDVGRSPSPGAAGALANAKFLEALFGADSVKNKRNIEAVEVGPNQLASARLLQYSPARQRPFEEVKALVREKVAARQAAALARKEGEARLAELQKAPESAVPGSAATVSRSTPRDVPRDIVDAALRAPADKLPAFVGVNQGNQGYAVVKIAKVMGRDPAGGDAQRLQAQYGQAWGDAEAQAYYAALKSRYRAEALPAAARAASAAAGS
ncbi:SurA N-terminal domain-containing protein [uncultured Piscinibacter sp.]|uniref:SurA N-terminal domain-containing protein n=1 Tax=uncultured Piscinibacter sp. TaxID=1131835 RepID=UPI00262954DF|nr:SurA N-terminal domain-containing protein [uncultured Piscinibacter sp.]